MKQEITNSFHLYKECILHDIITIIIGITFNVSRFFIIANIDIVINIIIIKRQTKKVLKRNVIYCANYTNICSSFYTSYFIFILVVNQIVCKVYEIGVVFSFFHYCNLNYIFLLLTTTKNERKMVCGFFNDWLGEYH